MKRRFYTLINLITIMVNIQEKFYKGYSSIMSSNKIDSDCKLILVVLIQLWINYKNINISNSKLSELLGIPDKTLRRKKKILQDLQLIKVIPSNSKEKGFESNKYEIMENNINIYFAIDVVKWIVAITVLWTY